jgi:hypothetical protein
MTIGTVDDAIAGALPPYEFQKTALLSLEAAGVWHSTVYASGFPGIMTAPVTGLNGSILDAPRDGLIYFPDGGGNETRLMKWGARSTQIGTLMLCDRLWDNSISSVTTTTLQAITSPTWPARDRNGATSGAGVLLGIEVSQITTTQNSTATVTYTNSAGTGSRTASLSTIVPSVLPASAVVGTFVPMFLQGGDVGVQSVQGITLNNSLTGGVISLVAYRPIASMGLSLANVESAVDLVNGGAAKLYDDSQLFFIYIPSVTTAPSWSGNIILSQG